MQDRQQGSTGLARRLLPLGVITLLAVAFVLLDLGSLLSFDALKQQRQELLAYVAAHPLLAPLLFIGLYVVVVAFSIPGAAVMTLAAGFLFGTLFGTLYAVTGATLGATILFLIAKSSLGDYLLARAGPAVKRMQAGFVENALSYLFVLRLIPIFPFFLVNLVPAFLGVPLRTYLIATFFGIMPGGFVYALAGAGLGSVFDRGDTFSIASIMTPQILAALVGLAVLALLPVLYKRFRRAPAAGDGDV